MKIRLTLLSVVLLCSFGSVHAENSVKVTTQSYKDLVIFPKRTASAQIEANNHATIPAEIAAIVDSVSVDLGDRLKKGDEIARLDCTDYQLAAQQARLMKREIDVQRSFEDRQMKRARKLELNKSIGQAEVDRIETGIQSLTTKSKLQDVAIAQADRQVSHCVVKAPFDGVVTGKYINEGEMLSLGKPVIKLLEQSQAKVIANVPLSEIKNIDKNANYFFETDDSSYAVQLVNVVPFVNQGRRNQTVHLKISEPNIVIGMEGRLVWSSSQAYLPSNLLLKRDGKYGTFVNVGGIAKFVEVANAQEGRPFVVSLEDNAKIVIEGRHQLDEGTSLTVSGE